MAMDWMIRVAGFRPGYQQNDSAEGSPCLQGREHLLNSVGKLSVGASQGSREGLVIKVKEVCPIIQMLTREGPNNQACYAVCVIEHNLGTVDTRGTLCTVSTHSPTQVLVLQFVVLDQYTLSPKA